MGWNSKVFSKICFKHFRPVNIILIDIHSLNIVLKSKLWITLQNCFLVSSCHESSFIWLHSTNCYQTLLIQICTLENQDNLKIGKKETPALFLIIWLSDLTQNTSKQYYRNSLKWLINEFFSCFSWVILLFEMFHQTFSRFKDVKPKSTKIFESVLIYVIFLKSEKYESSAIFFKYIIQKFSDHLTS